MSPSSALEPGEIDRQKRERAYRLAVVEVPRLRAAGFAVLSLLVYLNNRFLLHQFSLQAWALVTGLDATARDETLFSTEPFCGILSETALEESGLFIVVERDKMSKLMEEQKLGHVGSILPGNSRDERSFHAGSMITPSAIGLCVLMYVVSKGNFL